MEVENYEIQMYYDSARGCLCGSRGGVAGVRRSDGQKKTMEVRRITYQETKPFVLKIHYARRMPCIQYAFGLFDGEEIVGCVTYGQPASPSLCKGIAGEENRKRVLELNRLVIVQDGKNLASFLVGKSLRLLPKNLIIVSYADSGWGHVGYVYQATNWIYTGMTKARTDMYSGAGHSRHHDGDRANRQLRTAKHRYVYVTGNNKEILSQIKYEKFPYPKGESKRYDVGNPVPVIDIKPKMREGV